MAKQNSMFTGSNPDGYKAEIRQDPDKLFSVFTWFDDMKSSGVILWREQHSLQWKDAYAVAADWLKNKLSK